MDVGISVVKPMAGGRGLMKSVLRKLVHWTRKSFYLITEASINAYTL
jgi:hypothetical protein